MKAVILAGGLGSRLSEETAVRPKPMVEIGGRPILWHIMKLYDAAGIRAFVVCLGYKGEVVKRFFYHYCLARSDITLDLRRNEVTYHPRDIEPWTVSLVDTGEASMTGGRLKRVAEWVGGETFCMTYGDNLSDVDLKALVAFHRAQGKLATLTAVQPPGRFGVFPLAQGQSEVRAFREKPQGDGVWINGGFFVLEPGVFDYIEGDATVWEREPMQRLARDGQLAAYRHQGYWQNMDTLRDKMLLEETWARGNAPWKTWGPPA